MNDGPAGGIASCHGTISSNSLKIKLMNEKIATLKKINGSRCHYRAEEKKSKFPYISQRGV